MCSADLKVRKHDVMGYHRGNGQANTGQVHSNEKGLWTVTNLPSFSPLLPPYLLLLLFSIYLPLCIHPVTETFLHPSSFHLRFTYGQPILHWLPTSVSITQYSNSYSELIQFAAHSEIILVSRFSLRTFCPVIKSEVEMLNNVKFWHKNRHAEMSAFRNPCSLQCQQVITLKCKSTTWVQLKHFSFLVSRVKLITPFSMSPRCLLTSST